MQKNAVSVLGVSEVRWKGQGELKIGDYTVYYSGGDSDRFSTWTSLSLYPFKNKRFRRILEVVI
jgi:hypothetical protein